MSELESSSSCSPIRVGVIGLGRAAVGAHLPALAALPELFRVTAVCDVLRERRDHVVKTFPFSDLHFYRRPDDLLDDPDVDLVDIVLPSCEHEKCAAASLTRGKWTVVETPLAFTHDAAVRLRGASVKARGRLLVHAPGLFAPDFLLARDVVADRRLGDVYDVRVRHHDFVRRDDWQSVKRCGGGAVWYDGTDAMLQALALLPQAPYQMWSELKRVASMGDAEDYARILFKTRTAATADVEINGGAFASREPAFEIRGSRGSFSVEAGAREGLFRTVDPAFRFPRRRSSVRTPPLADMHEDVPLVETPYALDAGRSVGAAALWRAVFATVRKAVPFPVVLDDVVECVRYQQLAKQSSPFAL